ncbi:MAG TPA: DUF3000 domain-containing protein [Gordonia sp. (in: high G+C Gram-positive bacteria)]|uniref:DUF3000 domain-containing protein n=1 Tax=unclassified Gordonia (in: high G+C Gram-positive bacteria) TaxID=2657482 RepID=UPI000F981A38|nr:MULTISPECIES: DUF3000 domain-containing protein [unclassified Gordonia (in: high G+C Gram-positive bacteria)]RUP41348.1 MAG: DUF3000 domain-containing protein [Gordonia sp. (in: high G+C Gram-positive bacteria)]HNP58131.1 DUF3000 domain-containing protein [Gordonia sp. (in: high G+C Gram-positive bacteria)]HRC50466.1 DUF3000 domain-containing protein [Gordonia sp. (in: high G+C Gram-positive bacteria)]
MIRSGTPDGGAATSRAGEPADFTLAVESLQTAKVRADIEVSPIRPPQRLAPYSYAVGAEVQAPELLDGSGRSLDDVPADASGSAFGRLILLYDPEGHEAWSGTIRLVAYIQVDMEADLATDPMLPEVAWSWLTDALGVPEGQNSTPPNADPSAPVLTALGGTVTSTTSVRYGDIAGPPRAHQLELRASWTALDPALAPHLEAFCDVLAAAAGLPPTGVTRLKSTD